MSASRFTAVAIALLLAAPAAAGCGLGPGEGLGEVSLTVTRDYGSEQVRAPVSEEANESDTVMRVLERNADLSTRYGGGFVQSIDGIEGEENASGPVDWFFYVNGVESTVGAADYELRGGEAIWWDYRDWGAAMRVPAVVGSWPHPFMTGGYDSRRLPVALECLGGGRACGVVQRRLESAGADAMPAVTGSAAPGEVRILVGPWAKLREDPAAAQIERGPEASGVFAGFGADPAGGCELEGLDEAARSRGGLGAGAGLVAATRRYEAPPVWVVTGCDDAGVARGATLLDADDLRDRYAVAIEAGGAAPIALPLPQEAGSR